jgi:DNA repair protein RecO
MSDNDKGIVLYRRQSRELDLYVDFLSETGLRYSGYAKNYFHSKRRLIGCLEPGAYSSILLHKKGDTFSIIECELLESLFPDSLNKKLVFFFFTELVMKFHRKGEENKNVFLLYYGANKELNITDNLYSLLVFFVIKFFYYVGIFPNIHICFSCGRKIENKWYMSKGHNAFFCKNCIENGNYNNVVFFEERFIKKIAKIMHHKYADVYDIIQKNTEFTKFIEYLIIGASHLSKIYSFSMIDISRI